MNLLLSSLELCADQLVPSKAALASKRLRTQVLEADLQLSGRTLSLLARSAVSSVGIIVADTTLSRFVHPYLPRILSSFFLFEDFRNSALADNAMIVLDCDACLFIIASAILQSGHRCHAAQEVVDRTSDAIRFLRSSLGRSWTSTYNRRPEQSSPLVQYDCHPFIIIYVTITHTYIAILIGDQYC
jgi:hypothetical protein